jgi:GH35 family endo-1,4-beta-xylanase
LFKQSFTCAILAAGLTSVCCAQSLRQEAEKAGVLIGTAVRPSQFSETAYVSTLAREFSMVEAEDAMKW